LRRTLLPLPANRTTAADTIATQKQELLISMETEKILSDLNVIFKEVLENQEIELNPSTSAYDIEEWDSLTNIELIVAIEKHFNIKFRSSELAELRNVGQLCDAIKGKTGAN
jgi:acyl carrier protein